jgi:hypothetical protein
VLFNSLEFLLLFLPLTLVIALRLSGQPLLSWIAGSSVVFYAFAGHWWFIVPMVATTVIDYAIAQTIARSPAARRRAALLALSLTVNLGLLAYFKYAGLLTRTVSAALGSLGAAPDSQLIAWAQVTLPALVGHHAVPAWERRVSLFWRRNITFLLVTLGWVFFRSDTFEHAGLWFAALVGAHGLGRGWAPETGALLALVLVGLVIVRGFPNSLQMDLERVGPVSQTGLAFATAVAIFLMNYRSKFLYFQF